MFESKYSEENKKKWLEEFKNNNKPASQYAKEIGIPASTLRFWARKELNGCYNNSFGEIKILDNSKVVSNIVEDDNNNETQIKYCGNKITIILEKGYNREFLRKVVEVLVNDK